MSELTTDGGTPSWEAISRHAAGLTFEGRQSFLGELSEEERRSLFEATPQETLDKWVEEEKADFTAAHDAESPVEGAEFSTPPDEAVKIDGADEPQDRDPDADPGVIEQLVKEKLDLTRQLAAANAEIQAYYEAFGPLPSMTS